MKLFESDADLNLTDTLVREVLFVTPQHRRNHRECFLGLTPEQARNDDMFYPFLTQLLNGDLAPILKFDRLMKKERKEDKSFAARSRKAVARRVEAPLDGVCDSQFYLNLAEDDKLPKETRQLAHFVGRLIVFSEWHIQDKLDGEAEAPASAQGAGEGPRPFVIATPAPDSAVTEPSNGEETGADWQGQVDQILTLLGCATGPDLTLAQAVVEAAARLVFVAERHQAEAQAQQAEAAQWGVLLGRLAGCLTDEEYALVAPPADCPSDLTLQEIEEAVAKAETSTLAIAEIDRELQVIQETWDQANRVDDDDELARLLPLRKGKREALRAGHADRTDQLAALRAMFAQGAGTPTLSVAEAAPQLDSGLVTGADDLPVIEDAAPQADVVQDHGAVPVQDEADTDTIGEDPVAQEASEVEVEVWAEPLPLADGVEKIRHTPDAPAAAAIAKNAAVAPLVGAFPLLSDPTLRAEGWRGVQDMAALVEGYLRRGETIFAAQLVELAEARGVEVPVPGAVLRALHESRMALQPHQNVNQRLTGALDRAVAALAEVEAEGDDQRILFARRLVTASLLRPALFGAYGAVRPMLRQLRLTGPERNLATVLGGLGYDVHLSFDDLRALKGNTKMNGAADLAHRMASCLEVNRQRRTSYQPASDLLHKLFEPVGEIGRAFELAIAGKPRAEQEVTALLERFPTDLSSMVSYIEHWGAELRTRMAPIEGNALRVLCKSIEAAGELLHEWLERARSDRARGDDRRRMTLLSSVGQVRKAAEALSSVFAEEMQGHPAMGLGGAVDAAMHQALLDLMQLCDGAEPVLPPPRVAAGFSADLLRLTGGTQPRHDDDPGLEIEARDQSNGLYIGLLYPERHAPDLAHAFQARVTEGATLAAQDILHLARTAPQFTKGLDLTEAENKLDEEITTRRKSSGEAVERLNSRLAALWHLAGDDRDQVSNAMQRLTEIERALQVRLLDEPDCIMIPALNGRRSVSVPPDFPELELMLRDIGSLIERRSDKIMADQRRRLEDLARTSDHHEQAQKLLQRMAEFDLVTIDSMIGQIQGGLPFAAIEGSQTDSFLRFHPDIVEALVGKTDPAVRLVEQVLQGKGPAVLRTDLSTDQEKRALDLIAVWSKFALEMKAGNAEKMRAHLLNLLGALGFVRSKLDSGAPLIRTKLHRFVLNASLQVGREQFLPPVYGSEARERYSILIADESRSDSELSTQLGDLGRDRPSFLIVLGRWDRRRRENLAHTMRRERQTTVLLDESLMIYIALSAGNPLETLFACGLPYGWVQPYTTNPRSIPPEMFFGRKDEIQKITARQNGGCLVYGGRQLGKSALLNHVKRLMDQPGQDIRAIYLDIKPIGGRGMPADRLWKYLGDELASAEVFDLKEHTAEAFRGEVRKWIKARAGRQLLIMLDEADNFLAAEARYGGYRNLLVLKGLMEDLHWDFKVVFAGLHNVVRMSRAPNSPLPHLGSPICIGPLDSNAENLAEARRLVTAPMRAAGYDYADPNFAFSILARVNYYPSLVQVFAKSVVETAGKVHRPQGSGPYWKLGGSELFEGAIGRDINIEIQKRFQWTLELDWRYEAIAKVIALMGSEDTEGTTRILRTGLKAEKIEAMVQEFWPRGIPVLGFDELRELLQEMKDLGVLGETSDGCFVLRNAQVAQLLGSRDALENALLTAMSREEQVDYDPASFHSPLGTHDPDECAALTDRQLDDLLADVPNRGRVGVIVVQQALWNASNMNGFKDLIEMRADADKPMSVAVVTGGTSAIRSQLDEKLDAKLGRRVLLILGEWDLKVAQYLANHTRVKEGKIRALWLVPPSWLTAAIRNADLPVYVTQHVARPWTSAMLRHWLESHSLTRLDQPEIRAALLEVTAGLPALLRAILPCLQEQTSGTAAEMRAAILSWQPEAGRGDLRPDATSFGFTPRDAAILRELAEELMTSSQGTVAPNHLVDLGGKALDQATMALGLLEMRQNGLALSPLGRLLAK